MTHPDPQTLALLALGEHASAEDRLHVAGCAACRAELDRFARPVAAARAAAPQLDQPAPHVWRAIAAELGLDADPAHPVLMSAGRRRRPARRAVAALAAAAAVVVIGGLAVGLLALRAQPQRIASATLAALPDWPGSSGTAVLERLSDGRRVVQVRTDVAPDATTDHQVWLMTDGAQRLVSLGVLTGTGGTFPVPAGVDLDRFRLVDVSDEPRDGDPAHSGNSIVRGALEP
jgi:hypothetical protein